MASEPTARNTRQKRAIHDVLEQAARPLGTDEIHALAQVAIRGLGIATVYRAVRALVEEGWLTAVEVPGRTPLYERAGKAHHHHFVCNRCERVYELDGCSSAVRVKLPRGFVSENHELTIFGLCATCSAHSRRAGRSFPRARSG
jgi:Fur family ferric uptake transcriptional regulator